MVRWYYYRSIFDDIEDIREYVESLHRQIDGINCGMLLPAAGEPALLMLPEHHTPIPVTVSDNDDEVVVTAAMDAGTRNEDISLDLPNPLALEITCRRMEERADGNGVSPLLHGWMSLAETRMVPLPKPVTYDGSSAVFKNGVLEVRLKKVGKDSRRKIFID